MGQVDDETRNAVMASLLGGSNDISSPFVGTESVVERGNPAPFNIKNKIVSNLHPQKDDISIVEAMKQYRQNVMELFGLTEQDVAPVKSKWDALDAKFVNGVHVVPVREMAKIHTNPLEGVLEAKQQREAEELARRKKVMETVVDPESALALTKSIMNGFK